MTTAIIYTRFSPRPNAQECASCERQQERCKTYCESKGYGIRTTYSDENTSGEALDRPGLSAALYDLELAKRIDAKTVLVVDSSDRLARDMLTALTIRHEVEKIGGRIEFANGTTPAETPEGKLFGNILAAFAAYERDRVRFATSRGMKRRQADGEFFGKPPVGWKRDPGNSKRLIPCEQEQEAMRRALQLKLNIGTGVTSEYIADALTEEFGLFRGKPWSARTVRRIVSEGQSNDETS